MGLETFWFDGIALVNARAILYRFGMPIIGFGAFFYDHFSSDRISGGEGRSYALSDFQTRSLWLRIFARVLDNGWLLIW